MTVISDTKQIIKPLKNPVLSIGNFDGVHKGHLALFDKAKERAKYIGGQSAIITFHPHPINFMKPGNKPALITPTQQKMRLIKDAGIDVIYCLAFTKAFAAISARDFVHDILIDKIGVKEMVVGYDCTFGHRREGNISFLQDMGNRLGFAVHVVEPISIDGTLVSSTSIRKLVREGNLTKSKKLLGRDYQICGIVVKGRNRGARVLGFPTANLELIDELTPKKGVYAVKVFIDGQSYNGLINIGHNPTFGKGPFSVETHILDFSGDLLGRTIKINFIERLRAEKHFKTIEDLKTQICQDVIQAKEIFRHKAAPI